MAYNLASPNVSASGTRAGKKCIPPKSQSIVQPQAQDNYEDIHMLKLLNKAKFPVYLVASHSTNQQYALKLFEFEDGEPHQYYLNESRFISLNHPNIIKYVRVEDETVLPSEDGVDKQVSCIMMEFAPYGDFFKFVKAFRDSLTDKLVRTYFRSLIDGLEYLHKQGACHLDLKLENLLIGKDYQLKIADFDMSYIEGDEHILTKGTKYYRAPELRGSRCRNGVAADVYSAGIILFALKTGGIIPYFEDHLHEGVDLCKLLKDDSKEFFKRHCELQKKKETFFEQSFRELFRSMVYEKPEKRPTIAQIKKSKWYTGSVYSVKELKACVEIIYGGKDGMKM